MRQAITIFSLLGSFMVFALTINLIETTMMLLLFGVLPNRAEPIPANIMLTVYSTTGVIVFGYILQRNVARLALHIRTAFPKVTA